MMDFGDALTRELRAVLDAPVRGGTAMSERSGPLLHLETCERLEGELAAFTAREFRMVQEAAGVRCRPCATEFRKQHSALWAYDTLGPLASAAAGVGGSQHVGPTQERLEELLGRSIAFESMRAVVAERIDQLASDVRDWLASKEAGDLLEAWARLRASDAGTWRDREVLDIGNGNLELPDVMAVARERARSRGLLDVVAELDAVGGGSSEGSLVVIGTGSDWRDTVEDGILFDVLPAPRASSELGDVRVLPGELRGLAVILESVEAPSRPGALETLCTLAADGVPLVEARAMAEALEGQS